MYNAKGSAGRVEHEARGPREAARSPCVLPPGSSGNLWKRSLPLQLASDLPPVLLSMFSRSYPGVSIPCCVGAHREGEAPCAEGVGSAWRVVRAVIGRAGYYCCRYFISMDGWWVVFHFSS